MKNNNLLALVVILKGLGSILAVCGAVFLAWHDKDAWGWMVFLAIILGGFSITTKSNNSGSVDE